MSLHFQHKPSFAPAVRAISLILVLFLTLSIAITVVSAAITLNYFTATLEGEEVYLEWETASEMDLAGFYVVRSLSPDAEYTRISSFIYGEGDITGAIYNFTDTDIILNTNYYYKLEDVDINNNSSFHGPVVVGPATPTPSLTPTSTPETPTITSTPTKTTQPSKTPTFNPSASPSFTPTPTISPTPSVSPTASTTPTATPPEAEISLPEQLSFPTKTPTVKPLPSVQPTQSHTKTSSPLAKLTSTFSIIGGIIIFWVLLGVAYFKFIRPNN